MATKTRAEMIALAMQRLGVLGAGQTPSSEDSDLVGGVLDSVHDQYNKRGLAPFATSAFPAWSQEPYSKIIAAAIGPYFGYRGATLAPLIQESRIGERELYIQLEVGELNAPTEFRSY